jgi:hypothetical protein
MMSNRFTVACDWDWEWFSARRVWASDLNGNSRPVYLDEYLVLDFGVRLLVKSFVWNFQIMNLNHDRYATEAGVHPPGVNFRLGVDWWLPN